MGCPFHREISLTYVKIRIDELKRICDEHREKNNYLTANEYERAYQNLEYILLLLEEDAHLYYYIRDSISKLREEADNMCVEDVKGWLYSPVRTIYELQLLKRVLFPY